MSTEIAVAPIQGSRVGNIGFAVGAAICGVILFAALFVLGFAVLPTSHALFGVGNIDHHFAELLWTLGTLSAGIWFFRAGAPSHVPGIVLGCVLGLALVYKLRTQRAMAIAQTLVFSSSFLSIGQVPLAFQTGWLHTVSRVNPLTNVLRMTRQGFLEPGVTWHETWPGLVALVAMVAVLGTLAARGLRKLGP